MTVPWCLTAGWDDASLEAILKPWASVDGHDVEVDHDALVAAIYAEDGLPGDEWLDFIAALGEDTEYGLLILAMATCWKVIGQTLDDAVPGTGRNPASARLGAQWGPQLVDSVPSASINPMRDLFKRSDVVDRQVHSYLKWESHSMRGVVVTCNI